MAKGSGIYEMVSRMAATNAKSITLKREQLTALAKYMGRDEKKLVKFKQLKIKLIN